MLPGAASSGRRGRSTSRGTHRGHRSRSRRTDRREDPADLAVSGLLQNIMGLQIPGLSEEATLPIANTFEGKGLTELWQVEGLSGTVIDGWFPHDVNLIENLAVQKIQKVLRQHSTHSETGSKDGAMLAALEAQAETMKSMGARIKKDKKEKSKKRKVRSRSSSSVSADEKDRVNIPEALDAYCLQELNLAHFPDGDTLTKTVAKAKAHYASARASYVATGALADRWVPQWMSRDQRPKYDKDLGHPWGRGFAQFASCWWARALSQLAVQGKVKKETLSPTDFINQFLEICKMAQETNLSQAVTYDDLLWADMTDRLSKGDRRLDPSANMSYIVSKIEGEAEKKVKQARQTADSRSNRREDTSKPQWCLVCQTNNHDARDCKKVYCELCKKYGFHRTQDCYYSKKISDGKGRADKGKGSKAQGKGK